MARPGPGDRPLLVAVVRLLSVVVAALVVAVGFFDESLRYALVVGVVVGLAFAAAGHAVDSFDHS